MQEGPPYTNTAQPKQPLADTIPVRKPFDTTGKLVDLNAYKIHKSAEKPQSSNIVRLDSWKNKLSTAFLGEENAKKLDERNDEVVSKPQEEPKVVEEVTEEKPLLSNAKKFQQNKDTLTTNEGKERAVVTCKYIDELMDKCIPNLDTVSDGRGEYTPEKLRILVGEAYSGKKSLEEVPSTFGIREKVREFMKRNGKSTYEEKHIKKASTETEVEPQGNTVNTVPEVTDFEEVEAEVPVVNDFEEVEAEVPVVTTFEEVDASENIPVAKVLEEEIPVVDEIVDIETVDKKPKRERTPESIEIRRQYKEYTKALNDAQEVFLQKKGEFLLKEKETGVIARFLKDESLVTSKKEMLKAQIRYNDLIKQMQENSEKRRLVFIEEINSKFGTEDSDGKKQYIKKALDRHDALFNTRLNREVQTLENLRYQEGEKNESQYRLVRGMKAGFNWLRSIPPKKRILYGALLGGAIGGALGASGVLAGGALVAGGAMAGRRVVGGLLGSMVALTTKKFGDKKVEAYGERQLQEEQDSFTKENYIESRNARLAINRNVRIGKHVATVAAGGAAVLTGAGVANASHSVLDAFDVGNAQASGGPETNKNAVDTKTPDNEPNVQKVPPLNDTESYKQEAFNIEGYKPKSLENINFKDSSVAEVQKNTIVPDVLEKPTTLRVEGVYEKGSSVEKMLQGVLHKEFPDLTDVEQGKLAHIIRLEVAKHPEFAERLNIQGNDWDNVLKDGKYDITIDRDFIERKIAEMRSTVSSQEVINGPDIQQVIQDHAKELGIQPETNNVQPEKLGVHGVIEQGSSVEGELQQFLSENKWVQKQYPNLTKAQIGTIAGLLRQSVEDNKEAVGQFKIQGGNWGKVGAGTTYDFNLDTKTVEAQIQKVLSYDKEAVSQVAKQAVQSPSSVEKDAISRLVAEKAKVKLPLAEQVPIEKPVDPVHIKADGVKRIMQAEDAPQAVVQPQETTTGKNVEQQERAKMRDAYESEKVRQKNIEKELFEKRRLQAEERNRMYGRKSNATPPIPGSQVETIDGKPIVEAPRKSLFTNEHRYDSSGRQIITEPHKPRIRVETQKTLDQDFVQAEKILETNKADYHGMISRPSVESFFKKGIFDATFKGQRPMVLSHWGPMSHARMQDIFDGRGSISYSFGDGEVKMGAQAERFTRNIVGQLERGLKGRIPNVGEIIERAKTDNLKLGELVNQLSEKLKAQESATVASTPNIVVPEATPAPEPIKPPQQTTPVQAPAEKAPVLPKTSLEAFKKPELVPGKVIDKGIEYNYQVVVTPLEVSDGVKKLVAEETAAYPEWNSRDTAGESLKSSAEEYQKAVENYKKEIASALLNGKKDIAFSEILFKGESLNGLTRVEILQQLKQLKVMLEQQNGFSLKQNEQVIDQVIMGGSDK